MMKTTLLLLPGLMCDEAVWAPQVQAFSGMAHCVVPAYGLRDSLTAMAQQVLVEAPTERFSLVGHSMGGRVALFDAILDMLERSSPEQFAAQINALLNRPDASAPLPAITCPTLVLCGREDSWSPPAQHEPPAGCHCRRRAVRHRALRPHEHPGAAAGGERGAGRLVATQYVRV